jgi:pSer/pThr/pTyr-binding forkhead associated (FHA) protein
MKLSLVVLTPGKTEGKIIPITLSQFVIGRDPQCHLRPASAVISKRHCALLVREGKVYVRDFESTNGTCVNDQPIKGEVQLNHEDTLKVGPLLFKVHIEASVAVNRPTPPPETPAASESDDESAAALLLAMQDDSGTSSGGEKGGVPEGSTVMDILVPPGEKGEAPGDKKAEDKKKEGAKNPNVADQSTSNIAKAIFDKYTRRPRR